MNNNYKIPDKDLLPFISNKNLYLSAEYVLGVAARAFEQSEKNIYKNTLDPFSAVFDAMAGDILLSDWRKKEVSRQIQKTLQNALGVFHQNILGSFDGWKNLGTGNIVDIVNEKSKIIAEIKNKHNTTKGNHKTAIYDNLNKLLSSAYKDFTGYYVEVIPKGRKEYNNEFTPSDNMSKSRRPVSDKIRVIDGKSFYTLASGYDNALEQIYLILPKVIGDILGQNPENIKKEELFLELFKRAYR